jgi:4-hydroxybenzoate polyprenyltransferase
MNYLKLIRFQNLILIALMQILIRYGFLKQINIPLALNDFQFFLLILSTLCIASGGYIINNIIDQNTDLYNKPNQVVVGKSISENTAYNLYFGFTITGVVLGYYLSHLVMRTNFFGIFVIIALLLYIYATSFKQIAVIGNLLVSIALGLSVLIIGMFDIIPATDQGNRFQMMLILELLLDYAIFAFLINFIREIVKDLEDINGDDMNGMRTLPIVLGIAKTSKVVSILCIGSSVLLLWYINNHLMNSNLYYASIFALLFIISPLLFVAIKIWNAKQKNEFSFLSKVLKLIIFFGIISIVIVNLNIKYNA